MVKVRCAEERDLDAVYAISLATSHLGGDASHLYDDPRMVGHIYSAPYLVHAGETCFVAEDHLGVGGFVVGAIDTVAFQARLEALWWPTLRAFYAEPDEADRANWTPDQRRCFMIHHPERTPESIVARFPSHLHLNLLPRLQGRGLGLKLLERWLAEARGLGAEAVHVGVNAQNRRGVKFWERCAFVRLDDPMPRSRTTWLGRRL